MNRTDDASGLEDTITRSLQERAAAADFRHLDTGGAAVTARAPGEDSPRRSGFVTLSVAAVLLLAVVAGVWVVSTRSGPTAHLNSAAGLPARTSPSSDSITAASTTASTVETPATAINPVPPSTGAGGGAITDELTLPPGWRVTGTDAFDIPEGIGINSTHQVFGVLDGTGPSFKWVVELYVLPASNPDRGLQLEKGVGSSVQGDWFANNYHYTVTSDGLTQDQVSAFIKSLAPRDAESPLTGLQAPDASQLAYEDIGDGGASARGTSLRISIANQDGTTGMLQAANNSRHAVGPGGTAINRVLLGDRPAIVGPAGFGSSTLDWNGDGIQYTVITDGDSSAAQALAAAMAKLSDSRWLQAVADSAKG
ncbi:MAG: hypothetical protein JWM34_5198 [Ilumatobacteraceae bacterium]|nr:hypothetical protein [Ilumatobacteraceae bacterium]